MEEVHHNIITFPKYYFYHRTVFLHPYFVHRGNQSILVILYSAFSQDAGTLYFAQSLHDDF